MRVFSYCLAFALLAGGVAGGPGRTGHRDAVFQSSTVGALEAGVDDGEMTFTQLREHGDFGLGTLDGLDGEMVAVDGRFYQVRMDGRAYPIPGPARTPFAVVKWFQADRTLMLGATPNLAALERFLDRAIASPNVCTAVRIEGRFAGMTTRSVPRQAKPYPPLSEAVKRQKTFDLGETDGVMVGFRTPEYMAALNVAGYHFHFLRSDRKRGGHVLACSIRQAQVQIDTALGLDLLLPGTPEFARARLSGSGLKDPEREEGSPRP
jgi:acetolactate decarboxylase